MSETILSVKDLKVNYGGIEAVKGISFDVPKGSVVTLIGANGAGKSTTLKAIAGLVKPASGSISFKGESITGKDPSLIVSKGIVRVPEGRRVFDNMTSGTLSGGEQQMLAVARGLMARPEIIMMDEPSLGLAPLVVKGIFDIIREINKRGVTVLLIEQNANMALKVADYAYVLETGSIGLSGTGAQLLADENVKHAYLGK